MRGILSAVLVALVALAPAAALAQPITVSAGGASLTGVSSLSFAPITPAAISSSQNNYTPAGVSNLFRVSSTAAYSITGWVAAANGWQLCLENVGSFAITLPHNSGSSDAANRWQNGAGGDVVLQPGGGQCWRYSTTATRWVLEATDFGNTSVGTLTATGDVDFRANITNGGSTTCNSLGQAGANCLSDVHGTVITVGSSTTDGEALIVKGPAVGSDLDPIQTWRSGESATGWFTFFQGAVAGSVFAPSFLSRAIGDATTAGALYSGGIEAANDTGTASVVGIDCRREAGTPTNVSGSAVVTRPCIGLRNGGVTIGSFHVNGRQGLSTITPTSLAADVNNYAGCTTTSQCRINDGGSARNVTGITPGYTATLADIFYVCSVGSNNLTLVHESASSTAANRFAFNGATNRTVLAGSCFPLTYDLTSSRWRAANGT